MKKPLYLLCTIASFSFFTLLSIYQSNVKAQNAFFTVADMVFICYVIFMVPICIYSFIKFFKED